MKSLEKADSFKNYLLLTGLSIFLSFRGLLIMLDALEYLFSGLLIVKCYRCLLLKLGNAGDSISIIDYSCSSFNIGSF